jgi:hypothetical protein
MARSKYNYSIETHNIQGVNKQFLFIEDNDTGACSVTNDIENVIQEITQQEHIHPSQLVIAYKDTDGVWDGFDWDTQQFVYITAQSKQDVINEFKTATV